MIKMFCVGDNNVDIYEHTNMVYPGGSCVNAAAVACMNGHQASFVSSVGTDKLGDLQLDSLATLGVDVSHAHRIDEQTAYCFISLDNGERIFGHNNTGAREKRPLSVEDIRLGQNGDWDLLYTCIDAYYDEGAMEQFGKSELPAICDFTTHWTEESLSIECIYFDYPYLSCENLTEQEVMNLLNRCVHEWGAKLAIGTMGLRGSIAYNGRKFYYQEAYPVKAVDTLGAGDSFLSTFTVLYFDGKKMLDDWISKIDGWDENSPSYIASIDRLIEKSLSFAALRAARTCQDFGAFGFGIPFEKYMVKE